MAEIYVNSSTPIKSKIYWESELVNPDTVTVKVYDVTEDPSIVPAISPTTILTTLTATTVETDSGSYQVILPFTYTNRNRSFKLVWSYSISGTEGYHASYVDVVTPYININEHLQDLNFGSDPSDPNYKNDQEIQSAERYARKIIEGHTGQEFYLYQDVEVVYGSDSDVLVLPYKINKINKIYSNDILLIDNQSVPAVNNWIFNPIISETGFGVRINKTNSIDNAVYTANGFVPPSINDSDGSLFGKNIRYTIHAEFGWDRVPTEVSQACIELMKDYFSKDSVWRNKYAKNVQAFDWKFEYSSSAYAGTGNAYADQLLSSYVLSNMVVI